MSKQHIGFIGIGLMGEPMVLNLLKAGYSVSVYNRTTEKCNKVIAAGAELTASPKACAEKSDIITLCLTDGHVVENVLFDQENGIAAANKKSLIVVDHSTIGPTQTTSIANRAEQTHMHFVDIPVTGSVMGAVQATLTGFAGGDKQTIEKIKPIVQCYISNLAYMGESGKGQATKICNQIMVLNTVMMAYETIAMAKKQNLDLNKLPQAFNNNFFDSKLWRLCLNSELDTSFEQVAELNIYLKDLELIHKEATNNNSPIPVSANTLEWVRMLINQGLGKEDPRRAIPTIWHKLQAQCD